MDNLYIWYSPATDVTGKILKERLDCEGGTKKPSASKNVLCWGAKTSESITMSNPTVLNHPNYIRINRNKLKALERMNSNGCNVAPFTTNTSNLGSGDFSYPVIGRTKYHQGGSGFWLCLNESHVQRAVNEGAQYFQKFIHIENEYRLHVVDGAVIYAVKKVPRSNLQEAFVSHYKKHVENYAAKHNVTLDQPTLDLTLKRLARKMATGVDMITRSNTRGWKFSRVNLSSVPENLRSEAINAVAALNLDFGAVDCCIDTDGNAFVIECNTGPGLEGSSLEAWVNALQALTNSSTSKKAKKKAKSVKAVSAKAAKTKEQLKKSAKVITALIDAAEDDDELNAIHKLLSKAGLAD